MDTICTSSEFCGRKDPYTAKDLRVFMYVLPGGDVRYRIEGGYDVATPYPSMESACEAWSMKDGVLHGRQPEGGVFRCAYTGQPLRSVGGQGSFRFAGGFSPGMFHTREEILAAFAYLDGKPAPHVASRVEAPPPETPGAPRFHEHDISDDTVARAEELVGSAKRLLGADPSSPVSMHAGRRKGRRQA